MTLFRAQLFKEFSSYFNNLSAYIIIAAYSILSSFTALYAGNYFLRDAEAMNAYFSVQPFILLLILPSVTMRCWSEEIKNGTIELLLTQPISYLTLAISKFSAAFLFFILMLATSFPLLIISDRLASLDTAQIVAAYIGVFLCGMFFCAVGCLVSLLNRNSILSYISAIFVLFFITQITFTSVKGISLSALNFDDNFRAFLTGLISLGNICYFIIGTACLLWINVVAIRFVITLSKHHIRQFSLLCLLIFGVFCSFVLGLSLYFNTAFDITQKKLYTLTDENKAYLTASDKRIDITLYESKNKRQDSSSNYAVYAEYIEYMLQLIGKYAHGGVRTEIVLVEPFSPLERRLMEEGIPYEEDKFGNKDFIAAAFFDNDGNKQLINTFTGLRQNMFETDVMRVIRSFGLPQKKIAVLASPKTLSTISGMIKLWEKFYDVSYIDETDTDTLKDYDAVIVLNPTTSASASLLELEQYVLGGGSLILFDEPSSFNKNNNHLFIPFMETFGIRPIPEKVVEQEESRLGLGKLLKDDLGTDIETLVLNEVGEVQIFPNEKRHVTPLLSLFGKNIGAYANGTFYSNYLDLAAENLSILPLSSASGKVYFIYDTDLLQDYIYIAEESKGNDFYQIIPLADNQLFILRLLNEATGNTVEDKLLYKHYPENISSIGNTILQNIRQKHQEETDILQKELSVLDKKHKKLTSLIENQGYASVKDLGNLGDIAQNIDKTQDKLNKIRLIGMNEYQKTILTLTVLIVLIIPLGILLLLAIITGILRKIKSCKIRRMLSDAETH